MDGYLGDVSDGDGSKMEVDGLEWGVRVVALEEGRERERKRG